MVHSRRTRLKFLPAAGFSVLTSTPLQNFASLREVQRVSHRVSLRGPTGAQSVFLSLCYPDAAVSVGLALDSPLSLLMRALLLATRCRGRRARLAFGKERNAGFGSGACASGGRASDDYTCSSGASSTCSMLLFALRTCVRCPLSPAPERPE